MKNNSSLMYRPGLICAFLLSLFIFNKINAQGNMQAPAEFEQNEGALLVWDYYPARDSVVANFAGALQDHTPERSASLPPRCNQPTATFPFTRNAGSF